MQVKDPQKFLNQKEKTQWSTSWAGLPKIEMSTITPKICMLFLTTYLCLWNIYSKISVNK
jgi:hypothetical protein